MKDLVLERLLASDDVAAAKFLSGSSVDDPAREKRVLERVRSRARAVGLDPDSTAAFFRDQFTASKLVQEGLLARWAAHPEEAPTVRRDLGQIRDRLDLLTTQLLGELEAAARDLPVIPSERFASPGGSGKAAHLDALHRRALDVATRSVARHVKFSNRRSI